MNNFPLTKVQREFAGTEKQAAKRQQKAERKALRAPEAATTTFNEAGSSSPEEQST